MINKCDCGEKLIFDKIISILDRYDKKVLVCSRYYCDECSNEYEINEEVELETLCIKLHRSYFENWKNGLAVESWIDKDGYLCIKYESGEWWHYKINSENKLEWW